MIEQFLCWCRRATDTGYLITETAKLEVRDTTKAQGHHLHHTVVVSGSVTSGDAVLASIDQSLRTRIKANHSATHLMHEALRQVLGEHFSKPYKSHMHVQMCVYTLHQPP